MADTPACPRCGYDLSGTVRSWTDRCPTKGVCSECGLEFNWGALLVPLMRGTIGLFDSAIRPNVHCMLHSVLRCYRPWKLWPEALKGEHFRLRRTVLVAAVGVVTTHAMLLVLAQLAALAFVVVYSAATKDWSGLYEVPYMGSWPYRDWGTKYWGDSAGFGWIGLILTWSLLTALMGIAPSPRHGTSVISWRDWLRVWLHSFPTLPIIMAIVGILGLVQRLPMRMPSLEGWVIVFRLVVLTGWFALWWAFVYERYFDAERPWISGIAKSLIAGVIAILVIGILWSARIILGPM